MNSHFHKFSKNHLAYQSLETQQNDTKQQKNLVTPPDLISIRKNMRFDKDRHTLDTLLRLELSEEVW